MDKNLVIKVFHGEEIIPYFSELAALRMKIFHEFPYLYIGDLEYEKRYLKTYLDCPQSVMVAVFDKDRVVGASTAIPLQYEMDEFKQPFIKKGMDVKKIFYLGESVLLPEYRGQGIGKRFFLEREKAAYEQGSFTTAAFCVVDRPADHPHRPKDYVPLNKFWNKMGYYEHPEIATAYSWQEIWEDEETLKPMTFWLKKL